MTFAANVDSGGYKLLLLLHIVTVIASFGPVFMYALGVRAGAARDLTDAHTRISVPGVVVVGVLGFALVGASDQAWSFSQAWVSIAAGVWFLVVLDAVLLLRPALAGAAIGLERAKKQVTIASGLMHLGMVIAVSLMVFKPGL